WIILALIPITALFGSLAIALAAMARSTKEGQYYLMPLIMGFMPLMMLALFPTARLDFGTSLLPVTGVMLLLRHLMEGELRQVWLYALPVLGVTVGCCLLAIRWAVDQFSNESVLFRSSERFGIGLWLRQLIRERGPTPSIPEALLCGLVILIIRFFAGSLLGVPTDWTSFAQSTIVALVAFVAAPALLMTMVLTSGPRRTLLLSLPSWRVLGGAVLLAACLHPCATALLALIRHLFPIDESVFAPFQQILASAPSLWHVVLLMAVLPAICEELAFRGFILSGLRQSGARWQAVLISSVLFGIAHGAIQQSLMATLFGLLLGFLAIQTGSIFPCIAFHVTHNALGILASDWLPKLQAASTGLGD
ncbi:MAG TPA: CPBP family glutamic-type intramembrane protease, partial [Pirellulaceae bacterium]